MARIAVVHAATGYVVGTTEESALIDPDEWRQFCAGYVAMSDSAEERRFKLYRLTEAQYDAVPHRIDGLISAGNELVGEVKVPEGADYHGPYDGREEV